MPQNQTPPLSPQRQQSARPDRSPRPPADRTLQQRAWAAVLLTLIGVFGMLMAGSNIHRSVYVVAIGVVIALIALWLSFTAMSRAKRIGSSRPRGAIFAVVLGIIMVVLGGSTILSVLFIPQYTQFTECMQQAQTNTTQQACWNNLQSSVGGSGASILGRR
jgi:predicted PurR-regulated permease PerM